MDKAIIDSVVAADREARRVEAVLLRADRFTRGYVALKSSLGWIGKPEESSGGLYLPRVKIREDGAIVIRTSENYAVQNIPGWRRPNRDYDTYIHRTGRMELHGANAMRGATLVWLPV